MKKYTEQLREELWCDVMEDYVITAELGHLAKDEKLHKQEMRQHFDRLVEWITSKHTTYLSELRSKVQQMQIIPATIPHGSPYISGVNETVHAVLTLLDNDIQP